MKKSVERELVKLIERARLKDQNAMAMIEEVSKNAAGGLGKAKESLAFILRYIEAHPNSEDASVSSLTDMQNRQAPPTFSQETNTALSFLTNPSLDPQSILHILCFLPHSGDGRALEAACVILAKAIPLTPDRIKALDDQVIAPYKDAFHFGLEQAGEEEELLKFANDPVNLGYVFAGHCIGMSRRIQQARSGASLGCLSPEIGCELCFE